MNPKHSHCTIRIWLAGQLLLLVAATGSCGPETGLPQRDGFDDDSGITSALPVVSTTGSVLEPETRLAAYSTKANRLTLIDPQQKSEVWGRRYRGVPSFIAPLNDLSGVVIVQGTKVRVLSGDLDRDFALTMSNIGRVSTAPTGLGVAISAEDGKSTEVIKLNGTEWQQETFSHRWDEDAKVTRAFSYLGKGVMFTMAPYDGRYRIWHAPSESGPITDDGITCAGLAHSGDEELIRAFAFDTHGNQGFAGTRDGRVMALPIDACTSADSWPTVTLKDGIPVTDILVADADIANVTMADGSVHQIALVDGEMEVQSIASVCSYPLGARTRGRITETDSLIVVACYDVANGGDSPADAPATIQFTGVKMVSYDTSWNRHLQAFTIDIYRSAGIAVDVARGRYLRLRDSALGTLTSTDLRTGSSATKSGIFVEGILD